MSQAAIICVDDEIVILESLKRQLQSQFGQEYLYETAENVEEAWEVIESLVDESIAISAIISDWLMPGGHGDEFLIQVHKRFPDITKIFLTGQADEGAIKCAHERANLHCCLRKPWNIDELIQAIRSGLEK